MRAAFLASALALAGLGGVALAGEVVAHRQLDQPDQVVEAVTQRRQLLDDREGVGQPLFELFPGHFSHVPLLAGDASWTAWPIS